MSPCKPGADSDSEGADVPTNQTLAEAEVDTDTTSGDQASTHAANPFSGAVVAAATDIPDTSPEFTFECLASNVMALLLSATPMVMGNPSLSVLITLCMSFVDTVRLVRWWALADAGRQVLTRTETNTQHAVIPAAAHN